LISLFSAESLGELSVELVQRLFHAERKRKDAEFAEMNFH